MQKNYNNILVGILFFIMNTCSSLFPDGQEENISIDEHSEQLHGINKLEFVVDNYNPDSIGLEISRSDISVLEIRLAISQNPDIARKLIFELLLKHYVNLLRNYHQDYHIDSVTDNEVEMFLVCEALKNAGKINYGDWIGFSDIVNEVNKDNALMNDSAIRKLLNEISSLEDNIYNE